jgi:putative endonuclease
MAARPLKGLLDRLRPGASGEDLACRHLARQGYAILCRNFRCRSGEVDVVAAREGVTVFVEVKERRGKSYGAGFEAVTFGKRRRLLRAARLYAASRGLSETPVRFDVISIDWEEGRPRLRHDTDAFAAED